MQKQDLIAILQTKVNNQAGIGVRPKQPSKVDQHII